jgi:hypothetical protein
MDKKETKESKVSAVAEVAAEAVSEPTTPEQPVEAAITQPVAEAKSETDAPAEAVASGSKNNSGNKPDVKASEPVKPAGKKPRGSRPNPFGGRGKDGERMERRVRDNSNSYKPLVVPKTEGKFPLTLSVLGEFGASVCFQYLPSYDDDIAFLYQYIQYDMHPRSEGIKRVEDFSILVSRHFEFVFSMDLIRSRISNLKNKLAAKDVDVDRMYSENTRSVEIEVSSPHVLSFYEAIKLADEIIALNNVAYISGIISRAEAANEKFALVRQIEKEFNFINRIAGYCRNRHKWNPFPYFEEVRTRMVREDEKATAKLAVIADAGDGQAEVVEDKDKAKQPKIEPVIDQTEVQAVAEEDPLDVFG